MALVRLPPGTPEGMPLVHQHGTLPEGPSVARKPSPWFWEARNEWYVTIKGERYRLGADQEEAERQFHALMAQPPSAPKPANRFSCAWSPYSSLTQAGGLPPARNRHPVPRHHPPSRPAGGPVVCFA